MEPRDRDEVLKPIHFTRTERDLVLGLDSLDPEIENRFMLAVLKGDKLLVQLNAYDLDELLGSIAAVANHTEDEKLRKVLDKLFVRVSDTLSTEFPLDDIEAEAKMAVEAANSSPLEDFCGLSPDQMHRLIYEPFGPDSPLKFSYHVDDETLDQIPVLRLTEELLYIIEREGSIKLTTKLGALPRKVIQELYSKKIITEEFIESGIVKLLDESDSPALRSLHQTAVLSHVVTVKRGKLTLSKDGKRMLKPGNRPELFHRLLQTFTLSNSWASADLYSDFPIAQMGWGFSIYLLLRFGQKPRPVRFYAEKYLAAFPAMLQHIRLIHRTSPIVDFVDCYEIRTYRRFMEWFGMIRYISGRSFTGSDEAVIAPTNILPRVFVLRKNNNIQSRSVKRT